MYNVYIIINLLIIIILIVIISLISLDMKEPYPKVIINIFTEPYARFFSYMLVYAMSYYNNSLALLSMLLVLLLHIDFINLALP